MKPSTLSHISLFLAAALLFGHYALSSAQDVPMATLAAEPSEPAAKSEARPPAVLELRKDGSLRLSLETTVEDLASLLPGGSVVVIQAHREAPAAKVTEITKALKGRKVSVSSAVGKAVENTRLAQNVPHPVSGQIVPAPPTSLSPRHSEVRKRYETAEGSVHQFASDLTKAQGNPLWSGKKDRPQASGDALGGANKEPMQVGEVERSALKARVRKAFEARQDLLREELAEFRTRLDRLSKTLQERERDKQQIIDRRVEELLNPNLRWDVVVGAPGKSDFAGANVPQRPMSSPYSQTAQPMPAPPTQRVSPNILNATPAKGPNRDPLLTPSGATPAAAQQPAVAAGPDGDRFVVNSYTLERAKADKIAKAMEPLCEEALFSIRVVVVPETNTLIVTSRARDWDIIAALIKRLDAIGEAPKTTTQPRK